MKIAILAWGSLFWDKRELAITGDWKVGGPVLPVEFSRISSNDRLTLVIDPQNGEEVMTLFARSTFNDLNDAIANLRIRENNPPAERIGYVNLVTNTERQWSRQNHPVACDKIKTWAAANHWQAVIWTALTSNFAEKREIPFSPIEAVKYLETLTGESKALALEYIRRTPSEVDTPFRRLFRKTRQS